MWIRYDSYVASQKGHNTQLGQIHLHAVRHPDAGQILDVRVACGTWHETKRGLSIIWQGLTRQDYSLVALLLAQSTPRIQFAMREDYLSITLALIEPESAEFAIRLLNALGQLLGSLFRSKRILAKLFEVAQGHLIGKGLGRRWFWFCSCVPAKLIAGLIKPGTSWKTKWN